MSYQTGPQAVYVRSIDPTVDDDNTKGFHVGCRWLNKITTTEYILFDNTTGVAIWTSVTIPRLKRTSVTVTPYTVSGTDELLGVNYNGYVTINLPIGDSERRLIIKDESGNASNNPISIIPNGTEKIDGFDQFSIESDYASITIYFNETEWNII